MTKFIYVIVTMPLMAVLLLSGSASAGVLVASDDFESNSLSGGSGWAADWTGNEIFVSNSSQIDGQHSLGLFSFQGPTTSTAKRLIGPSVIANGTSVQINWSMKAAWDVFFDGQLGANIVDSSENVLLTYKFAAGSTNLLLNDGGSDFAITDVTFNQGDIYDFEFLSEVGSSQYSFTVDRRGSPEIGSGNNFTYSSGRFTGSVGGLFAFATTLPGVGNDGFLDSVSVSIGAVPEPTSFAIFGFTALSAVGIRRRR